MLSLIRRTPVSSQGPAILASTLCSGGECAALMEPSHSPGHPQRYIGASGCIDKALQEYRGPWTPRELPRRSAFGAGKQDLFGTFASGHWGCGTMGNEGRKMNAEKVRRGPGIVGDQRALLGAVAAPAYGRFQSGEVGKAVAAGFRKEPQQVAMDIARSLGSLDRSLLISALSAVESRPEAPWGAPKSSATAEIYAATLFDSADQQTPKGLLDRTEFMVALDKYSAFQKELELAKSKGPLRAKSLMLLAVATGIPYIGFGFLDNFIMILAGEEIEKAFGLALGLSTMAAAAMGNTFSDIAGIWMAGTIEQKARKLKTLRPPKLSNAQEMMTSVRAAKGTGAIIGVIIGCTLGMAPLLYYTPI